MASAGSQIDGSIMAIEQGCSRDNSKFVLQLVFWGIHSGSQMNLWFLLLCINRFIGICVRREDVGIIFHMKTCRGVIFYTMYWYSRRCCMLPYVTEIQRLEFESVANTMNSNDMFGARGVDLNFFP